MSVVTGVFSFRQRGPPGVLSATPNPSPRTSIVVIIRRLKL